MTTITSTRLRLVPVHLTTPLNFAVLDAFQCPVSGHHHHHHIYLDNKNAPKKENNTCESLATATRGVLFTTIECNASF